MSGSFKSKDFNQMPETLRIRPEVQTLNTGLKIAAACRHLESLENGPCYLPGLTQQGWGRGCH